METIELTRRWLLGGPLASGGFGRVYEAQADDGSPAVIKLVPKAPGANRELLFEDLSGKVNILPILDTGEWQDQYVLVMPLADESLRTHLTDAGGRLLVKDAVPILIDVAEALASLNADVVHRDLKPENILLYNGHWCLADFGIARYAEATTAPDTHKYSMTPPYAAPEQWRGERATSATDVYALGVMAFEMIEGKRPFPGPDTPDYREQHLTQPPPLFSGTPPSILSLVAECLYKPQAARPTPAKVVERLRAQQAVPSPALDELREVNAAAAQRRGEEAAKMSAEQIREGERRELFTAASTSFHRIVDELTEMVREAAPQSHLSGGTLTVTLESGTLQVGEVTPAPAGCLAYYQYDPPFDVIAYSQISVRQPRDRYDYEGRAHSLWFCDAKEPGVYRWYELAFMKSGFSGLRFVLVPTALPPTDEQAAGALNPFITTGCQIAWQPVPFDQGDQAQFIERWLKWFAAAATSKLRYPTHMPEQSGGSYRYPPSERRK